MRNRQCSSIFKEVNQQKLTRKNFGRIAYSMLKFFSETKNGIKNIKKLHK